MSGCRDSNNNPRRVTSPALGALLGAVTLCVGAPIIACAEEISVPGTTVKYNTYIEGEGGYDSNPDSLFRQAGSPFERVEGSFKVTSTTATETYDFTLKGRDIQFNDLDDSNRWDAKATINGSLVVGQGQKLSLGTYYLRDFVALDKLEVVHSYGEYAVTGDDYRVRLETRSHIEHNLGEDVRGLKQIQDDFDVSRGAAFDYSRTDGRVSAIAMTKAMLQPFMIYNFGGLDYFNQASGASIDRSARDQFAIAGLRFEFDKTLRVDVGGRVNHRDFDDKAISTFTRGFVDINAHWQPTQAFKATLVIERFLREPTTSFGLADDVRSVALTAEYRIDPLWRINAAGYYDRVEAVGDDFRYNKYSTTMSLTYEPNKSYEIFVSGIAKWVTEEVSGESYTRFKIGSGVRFNF